ncbi:vacuolar membrane protein [Cordyceps javanica]|uniref:Vacuolar membrane protein n=1 Tax=Cordyceps javanica TaxID=43265 RepID=A0A545UW19_9HYPO|nr:vacuolar membrane protein [Cordyceps javanica]
MPRTRSDHVLITMMVTNALLGGIADTVAQVITAFRHRVVRKPGGAKDETITVEMHELGRKSPYYEKNSLGDFGPSTGRPPSFDFERLTRFMGYGFCVAPLQFRWFKLLERLFPMSKTSSFGPALKRVAFDQIVFAPFGVALFFTAMTVAEGGGRRAVSNKLRDMYVPTLKANYVVWPAVQLVNFRLMPVQYQLVSPFVSTVGIAWTAYLSLTNSTD